MKPYAYRASEEMRMKAELSRKEAESLIERDLKCLGTEPRLFPQAPQVQKDVSIPP